MNPIDRNTLMSQAIHNLSKRRDLFTNARSNAPNIMDYLSVIEGSMFTVQLVMLLLRGASVADCKVYAATGNGVLPFEGCEQRMFDALLDALKQRADTVPMKLEFIESYGTWISNVFDVIEQETGVPRTSLLTILSKESARA